MCGIIGYIGNKDITKVLLNGLKRLEYRGYDSAGICVVENNKDKNSLKLKKAKGKIINLEEKTKKDPFTGKIGIAHTRWATHGIPNITNAHPHTCYKDEIAIVHNGIIENYQSIREILKKDNIDIKSETDSELVAHLIQKFYEGNLELATKKALKIIEGAYGLAIIHKNHEEIIVAKKGSPLILGVEKDEMFVASDVSAILKYTKNIIYLNDNEIGILKNDSYEIKESNGITINKEIHEIKWSLDQIEKQGYKHFMLKEIFEQPTAIKNTIRGRIKNKELTFDRDIDISKIKKIIITACGTSWHSALIGKYYFEQLCKIPVEVDYASEFRYRDPLVTEDDLMIVLSQSGETADTLAALNEAKNKGANTYGIVNTAGSTIARETNEGMYLHIGPEIGVASTKAFTTQVINLLITALMFRKKQSKELSKQLLKELQELPNKISEILKTSDKIKEIAKTLTNNHNMLYLGRGMNFPVALEGALKLKEISYIHAEGYPAAEMKHGPIALIDQNMPIVFIAPKDNTYDKILSNIEEIKARGGKIIALIEKKDKEIPTLTNNIITIPKTCPELSPIVNIIPLQLLSYHVANLKGLDVDKPRNLAKSVTVE